MNVPFCQHIHLFCPDLNAMTDFWVKGFGGKVEEFRKFGAHEGAALNINSATKLYLSEVQGEQQDKASLSSRVDHLGMEVADLDKALAVLLAIPGVTLTREPFVLPRNRRAAFVSGPGGISIAVLQKG